MDGPISARPAPALTFPGPPGGIRSINLQVGAADSPLGGGADCTGATGLSIIPQPRPQASWGGGAMGWG